MNRFGQFKSLCIVEVIGYVLAGPIANQVLIARWFHRRRGRAMGYAYLGLGLGGVTAPMLVNFLARYLGWRPLWSCLEHSYWLCFFRSDMAVIS